MVSPSFRWAPSPIRPHLPSRAAICLAPSLPQAVTVRFLWPPALAILSNSPAQESTGQGRGLYRVPAQVTLTRTFLGPYLPEHPHKIPPTGQTWGMAVWSLRPGAWRQSPGCEALVVRVCGPRAENKGLQLPRPAPRHREHQDGFRQARLL